MDVVEAAKCAKPGASLFASLHGGGWECAHPMRLQMFTVPLFGMPLDLKFKDPTPIPLPPRRAQYKRPYAFKKKAKLTWIYG
jgi:hypothetical protein